MNQEQRAYVMASQVTSTTTRTETAYVILPRPAEGALFVLTVETASGTIRGIIQKGWRRPDTIVNRTTTVGTGGLLANANDFIDWADWVAFTSTTTAGRQTLGVVRSTTSLVVSTTNGIAAGIVHGGPLGVYYRAAAVLSGTSPQLTYLITGEFEF